MVWNLFGRKKEAKKKTAAVKKAPASDLPPIMEPGDTTQGVSARPNAAKSQPSPSESDMRLDALTVMAAIESAKQELAARESAIARSASRQRPDGRPATEDPVAQKKQLIQAAMTVHRLKQSSLSDLNQAEREKLRGMAETALGVAGKTPKR